MNVVSQVNRKFVATITVKVPDTLALRYSNGIDSRVLDQLNLTFRCVRTHKEDAFQMVENILYGLRVFTDTSIDQMDTEIFDYQRSKLISAAKNFADDRKSERFGVVMEYRIDYVESDCIILV